jgi:hypothetical protein
LRNKRILTRGVKINALDKNYIAPLPGTEYSTGLRRLQDYREQKGAKLHLQDFAACGTL